MFRPRPLDWKVDDPQSSILDLVYSAEEGPFRLHLPAELLSMQGSFGYCGWHPFVDALHNGVERLSWFYERFQPRTLQQMYFLSDAAYHSRPLPPWELPWLYRRTRSPPPGEAGLSAEHGASFYGPATPQKIEVEYHRLLSLRDSIAKRGYQPDSHGDIQGHFLRVGDQIRFFVRGGKHRTAVLVSSGMSLIPVQIRTSWPRIIDAASANDWPMVRTGAIDVESAQAVLSRYIDFDGTQQRTFLEVAKVDG
jgi:hypothetical protein